VPKRERARRLETAHALCRQKGVVLTAPRSLVLEAAIGLGTHPTADEVHAAAHREDPRIGRATVYRALEAFVAAGVFTKASHTGVAVRYDSVPARHHHLVCLRCDRIIDLTDERLDAVPVPDTSSLGFSVSDVQVQFRGLCRDCLKKEEEK
jgi:Fe2+ or Zn2+ uptake regulation protein